jgi:DNA-binding MarR family transcriptional regulator
LGKALDLDQQLCFSVYAAAHAFNRFYKPLLVPLGLTYPQYLVLLVLWKGDGVPLGSIGERLGLDSGTLTPLLKRMEAAGLLVRQRAAGDERQVLVTLTDKGRALEARAASFPTAIGKAAGCSAIELDDLRQRLFALGRQLDAAIA